MSCDYLQAPRHAHSVYHNVINVTIIYDGDNVRENTVLGENVALSPPLHALLLIFERSVQ